MIYRAREVRSVTGEFAAPEAGPPSGSRPDAQTTELARMVR